MCMNNVTSGNLAQAAADRIAVSVVVIVLSAGSVLAYVILSTGTQEISGSPSICAPP